VKKVLWVKFGWSEYYRGGPVDGNFGWLKANRGRKNEGRGHEAFNFMPAPDGTYYCYVPPQTKGYAPWNDDNKGWTVVCLAKNPKHTGIHVVGWYEDATLLGDWKRPPSNHSGVNIGNSGSAYDWSYCIKSKSAFFIPPERRTNPFSDPSVRHGKYSFLVGPEVGRNPGKDRVLTLLEARLTKLRDKAVHNPTEAVVPDPELDPADPLKGFGTPEHRKKVERAAERAVIAYYKTKGFNHSDRTKESCGYDFLFWKGAKSLHVEVKGTSGENAGFFLTHNEHAAGYKRNPAWRLAMVTNALSDAPVVEIFDAKMLRKSFDLTPYVFLGRPVAKTGGA
jgi:hypothetical protein